MRNERHPTAAPDATCVNKHRLGAYGHGGQSHHTYIRGPSGVLADSRAPFCEYAMRGSPRAHPTLFVSPSTNRTYAVMVDVSTVRISEAPGVNIAYWKSRFANTQCEAVWRCITLGLHRHAPNKHHFRRRSCHNRESSRCRRDIAFSRAHLAKNAMQAIPPPHTTQLGSPRTKHIPA